MTNRIEGLDLLRGFAILLVLIRHSWSDRAEGAGIVGVVVFFGLSGFLITGILLRDLRTPPHKVQYRHFYRNRILRLVPALAFMLAVFAFIELTFNVLGEREGVPRGVLVGMTYTMNLPGFGHGSDSLSHLWTLVNRPGTGGDCDLTRRMQIWVHQGSSMPRRVSALFGCIGTV